MFFSYTSYYLAIAAIPLALAVTLFFCCPLFITILSVLFLDEKMDKKGWTALLSGFIGVLVIMGPDLSAGRTGLFVNPHGSFLAMLSVFFMRLTRSAPENSEFMKPALPFLLVLGFVSAAGTYCLSQAYRITDASVVAPFEYLAIPISVSWDYEFWKEVPGRIQILGILMIIAGGIYVLKKKVFITKMKFTGFLS